MAIIETKTVCIWPDGGWCDPEELDFYIRTGSSDDVVYKEVPLDWEGE